MTNDDSAADASPATPPALSPRDRARRALRFDREFRESTSTLSLSEVLQLVEDRVADAIADAEVAALAGRPAVPQDDPRWQRLYNVIATLAHPRGDHRENALEDEAHDLLRDLRALAAPAVPSSAPPELSRAEWRFDATGALDDVVVENVKMFRMERMAPDHIWGALYYPNGTRTDFNIFMHDGQLALTFEHEPKEI